MSLQRQNPVAHGTRSSAEIFPTVKYLELAVRLHPYSYVMTSGAQSSIASAPKTLDSLNTVSMIASIELNRSSLFVLNRRKKTHDEGANATQVPAQPVLSPAPEESIGEIRLKGARLMRILMGLPPNTVNSSRNPISPVVASPSVEESPRADMDVDACAGDRKLSQFTTARSTASRRGLGHMEVDSEQEKPRSEEPSVPEALVATAPLTEPEDAPADMIGQGRAESSGDETTDRTPVVAPLAEPQIYDDTGPPVPAGPSVYESEANVNDPRNQGFGRGHRRHKWIDFCSCRPFRMASRCRPTPAGRLDVN
ncbi:hypothetical protein DFH09DRAFT_1076777 [Mycena vulgaris]|nr:hypothetical protein DFH09DRAFT_1076777 [Mycena vulgaris]